MNNPEIENALEELTHENAKIRSQAVLLLGWCGELKVVEPIIGILEDDPSPQVRTNAAMALGELGNHQAVEALMTALHRDKSPNVRAVIAYSLGLLGKDQSVNSLIEILLNDINCEARIAAAEALVDISSPKAIRPLVFSALYDEDEIVRQEAYKALEKLCEKVDYPNKEELLKKEIQRKIRKEEKSAEDEFLVVSPDKEEQKQREEERKKKIEEIIQDLPSLLEFAFDQEIIYFREIRKEYGCDDQTIAMALKILLEKDKINGYIDRENHSFIVKKKDTLKLSPEAKEKLKLLRKKYGFNL